MAYPIGSETRANIRQSIAYNIGGFYLGTSTTTGSTTTIIDTGLTGGDNEHRGKEVIILTATEDIVGEKSIIQSYDAENHTLILYPALSVTSTADDTYGLYDSKIKIAQIDQAINQAIIKASNSVFVDVEDDSIAKEEYKYEYGLPTTTWVALHSVEYVSSTGVDTKLHNCDTVWDELVDGDVTAAADTDFYKEGSGCLKLTVAAGCGAGDILATEDIDSTDISDCDELIIWVHSTTALDAGDLQVLLDNTAQCASALESLDIPATSANTWTRHIISLANPYSDTAIISVGIKMVTDKGAFTLRVDDIRAQSGKSRIWQAINPGLWTIVQGSTPYLKLTEGGYSKITNNALMRLQGYKIPSELSADSSTSEVDPDFVVAFATARLLMSLGDPDKAKIADWWLGEAKKGLLDIRTSLAMDTRWVQR